MKEEGFIALFEKYLNSELSTTEHNEFEERLAKDSNFKKEFEQFNEAKQIIKIEGRQKLREKISLIGDNIHQDGSTNKTKVKIMTKHTSGKKNNWMAIAASFLVLAAVGIWFFNQNSTDTNPEELFASTYKKDTPITARILDEIGTSGFASTNPEADTLSTEDPIDMEAINKIKREEMRVQTLTGGLKSFKKSNWKEARVQFNTYIDSFPEVNADKHIAEYYFAKSCLNMGDYAIASERLGNLNKEAISDKELKNAVKYDLATTYLMVDEKQAILYFDDIAGDNGHPNQHDAKAIIDGLR